MKNNQQMEQKKYNAPICDSFILESQGVICQSVWTEEYIVGEDLESDFDQNRRQNYEKVNDCYSCSIVIRCLC